MLAPTALPRERFSPLAQSVRPDLNERMSAIGSAAEEIARSMAVDHVAYDPLRSSRLARLGSARARVVQAARETASSAMFAASARPARDGLQESCRGRCVSRTSN